MDKISFGLDYTPPMRPANTGNSIYRTNGDEANVETKNIVRYVRHATPPFDNTSLVNERILSKKNTKYSCVSRMVSNKPVNSNNNWGFEIGVESGSDIPVYVIVAFQTAARAGPYQTQNNAIFDRLDVIEASCNVGTVGYPDKEYQKDFQSNKYIEHYNEIFKEFNEYFKEKILRSCTIFGYSICGHRKVILPLNQKE